MNDYFTALAIIAGVCVSFLIGLLVGSIFNNRFIAELMAVNAKLKIKLDEYEADHAEKAESEKAEILNINIKNDIDEKNIPDYANF